MFDLTDPLKYTDSTLPIFRQLGVELTIRLLGETEPITGGNKWYKLKFNLIRAKNEGFSKILTFGGAFSNHIAATARVGRESGFKTVGIIRGEEIEVEKNITLSRASSDGMKLIFIPRKEYRLKNDVRILNQYLNDISQYFIIPEGGANADGVAGSKEIISAGDEKYNHIVVSCGTGTTAAGIILGLHAKQKLTGISVLRDGGSIATTIQKFLSEKKGKNSIAAWEVNADYHFGGYARSNSELIEYCKEFHQKNNIQIEPVYTGKMFWGLEKLIGSGYFGSEPKILAIHTGGLQYLK